jgi:hypothetical protein
MKALKNELGALLLIAVSATAIFGPLFLRPVDGCVVGDMAARLAGEVPESLREVYLDARRIKVGLGAAAVGGWESLGDALVAEGRVWLRTTHPGSPRYYRTVSNPYFQSNAFVHVPAARANAGTFRVPPGTSMRRLWEELASRYPRGVIAAGGLEFAELHTIAIAVPAIDGHAVLMNAARYYTRPMESRRAVKAYVVMMAARAGTSWFDAFRLRMLPPAGETGLAALAHALPLGGAPAPGAEAVGQIVASSLIDGGELALYPITRVGECPEAVWK